MQSVGFIGIVNCCKMIQLLQTQADVTYVPLLHYCLTVAQVTLTQSMCCLRALKSHYIVYAQHCKVSQFFWSAVVIRKP